MKTSYELYAIPMQWSNFTPPSALMVKTLKTCVDMENRYPGKPYGPKDVKGSLAGLYKRGLVDIQFQVKERRQKISWYVTNKGLHFLLHKYRPVKF